MKNYKLVPALLVCLFALLGVGSAHAVRYYFQKPDDWEKVNIHFWKDGWNNPTWPGYEAHKYDKTYNGKAVYYYDLGDTPAGIIFNNGKSNGSIIQTDDITGGNLSDGMLYTLGNYKNTNSDGNKIHEFGKIGNPNFDSAPTPTENTYTFYLVNNSGWSAVCAHYFNDNGNTTKWPGSALTLNTTTGKKVKVDSDIYENVYECKITANYKVTKIIFNNNDSGSETATLDFADKNLYILGTNNSCVPKTTSQYSFVVDTQYPSEIVLRGYYEKNDHTTDIVLDKDGDNHYSAIVKFENTTFPDNNSFYFWLRADNKTYGNTTNEANKTANINGGENEAKQLNNTNIRFKVANFDGEYVVNAWWEGDNIKFTIKPRVMPESERTLYMHFCQNYHKKVDNNDWETADRSITPWVQLWKSRDQTDDPEERGMEKVTGYGLTEDDDLYKIVLEEADMKNFHDVTFCFKYKNPDHWQKYRAGKTNTETDGTDYGWDADNWTKYIYTVSDYNKAAQSYITFEEYKEIRQNNPQYIYLTGKGFKQFDDAGQWSISNKDMLSAEASMGVFYPKFTWSDDLSTENFDGDKDGVSFKMSWLHPWKWHAKAYGESNTANMHDQRCWSTFNLGLIGYDLERVENNQTLRDALDPQVNVGTETVLIETGKTMPQNNYNQYDWFMEKTVGATQTLVVDLDGDCQSVTLLPFEPQPAIKAEDVTVDTYTYADAHNAWKAGTLKAENTNGKVLYQHVNVASANATITGPEASKLSDYKYKVDYEVYSNRQRAGRYTADGEFGGSANVRLEAIAYGSAATLGVRGKFTDQETKLTFHTVYNESAFGETAALLAPSVVGDTHTYIDGSNFLFEADGKTLIKNPESDPRYTLGARGNLNIEAPAYTSGHLFENAAWYGDFYAEADVNNDKNHHLSPPWHANGGELKGELHTPWHETTFTNGYSDNSHNWSKALGVTADNGLTETWPIELPEVVEVHRTYGDDGWTFEEEGMPSELTINMMVGAVYPFLIDNDAVITTTQSHQLAPRRKAGSAYTPISGHNYSIVTEAVYTDYPITLKASSDLTGVSEAFLGTAAGAEGFDENAPVEYYNLQGMRVGGDLAPGIYIRRQGNKVEKMIIR